MSDIDDEKKRAAESGPEEPDVILNQELLDGEGYVPYGFRFTFPSLDPEFARQLANLLVQCEKRKVIMVPYTGIRDPWEQARLWRQSRSSSEVNDAIKLLRDADANFLVQVMNDVGPQPSGPDVTGALPGFSWHQWGEAADSYWSVGGKPEWDILDGYKIYAEEATKLGLTAGGYWTRKDWPHVQLSSAESPSSLYSTKEIDTAMLEKFGSLQVLARRHR